MVDYSDFEVAKELLKEAQDADQDNRELTKEAHLFVSKSDGQWEPERWNNADGKPRYTFDQVSPIIDQISGDIDDSDFDVDIQPESGDANEDTAKVIAGMVRNIERVSKAKHIYAKVGRNVVTAGLDNWEVSTEYSDNVTFNKDLIIRPIPNSSERVWFGLGADEEDRSDSSCGFILSAIPAGQYNENYPDGTGASVSQGQLSNWAYYNKADHVIIGNIFYKKETEEEIIITSMGRHMTAKEYKDNSEYFKMGGEVITDTRTRIDTTIYLRKFDNDGWLSEPEATVFDSIPVIPAFGNYKVIENKTVYHGVVQKLMDSQRVLNYSLSREIEEGALAPRAKYWMTSKQAAGFEGTLRTMNTNSDPVQFFNPDPNNPGVPQQNGGAQINPGLRTISESMQALMGRTSGIFAAGMGDNMNAQSGVAIGKLQDKSNNITSKFFSSLEIAIGRQYQILVDAIPKIYDTHRQVRIVNSDGSTELVEINKPIIDPNTGQQVGIENDLSIGDYSAKCTSGPSFDSRRSESINAITELAIIDPSIMQTGADVLLGNLNSPGVDKIAERKRLQLFNQGMIPESQMTDEEKQQYEQIQQQPKEPDAMMVMAQAEQAKADMQGQKNQLQSQKDQMDAQFKQQQNQLDMRKQEIELMEKQAKLGLNQDSQQFNQMMAAQAASTKSINDAVANLNTQADTLNKLREAMAPPVLINEQVNDIGEAQE